jgi:AAHS family 4-hydroxybenzoate transporter-like MFS transporter
MGLDVSDAAIVASIFSIGGICGGIGVGRLIDRTNPYAALVFVLFIAALSTIAVGMMGAEFTTLSVAVFVAGFCVAGGQHGANAHAGQFYPTFMRATGIGWAMGIGRIGSVLGPLLLGELLKAHWPLRDILQLFGLIVATSAFLFGIMGLVSRAKSGGFVGRHLQSTPAKAKTSA